MEITRRGFGGLLIATGLRVEPQGPPNLNDTEQTLVSMLRPVMHLRPRMTDIDNYRMFPSLDSPIRFIAFNFIHFGGHETRFNWATNAKCPSPVPIVPIDPEQYHRLQKFAIGFEAPMDEDAKLEIQFREMNQHLGYEVFPTWEAFDRR